MTGKGDLTLEVLIPVFNDWDAVAVLLPRIDAVLGRYGARADVLLVDDGSTDPRPQELTEGSYGALGAVRVLRLRRNLGHQRAIAVGLAYLEERSAADAVAVMDGDGQDDPEALPALLDRMVELGHDTIVFAGRRRRAEGLFFRAFYYLYASMHRALTGFGLRVGNFSVIPRAALRSLVAVGELWNHYAAAVYHSRLPHDRVPTPRAARVDGHSKMNFIALVTHGLSAISVYADRVGVRLLVGSSVAFAVLALAVFGASTWGLMQDGAVPGWIADNVGVVLVLFVQFLLFTLLFCFIVLRSRIHMSFIPHRDYGYFVDSVIGESPAVAEGSAESLTIAREAQRP
jgi:glycosyltransferase involved in cell wall biosynthesis